MATAVQFVTDKRRVRVTEIQALFAHAPWAQRRTPQQIRRMLQGSDLVVLARNGQRPVGCARLITDGVFRGFVEDVIVAPAYREQGIGTRMMRRLERAAQRMGVARLDLVTQRPEFWRQLGYARKMGSRYMVKRLNRR